MPACFLAAFLATSTGCGEDEPPFQSSGDLVEDLLSREGVLSVDAWTTNRPGYTLYSLTFSQPVDHGDPNGQQFTQKISLMHRSTDAPMVLASTGYYDFLVDRLAEPTELLSANQLVVEHRYFADSRPDPADWSHLTIEQAAADHHRIVEALRPIYDQAWVSTGVSKGGMTSVYHRRFYPDDVDATIAYVAPISFDAPDQGYYAFFDTVGDATGHGDCREAVKAMQRAGLQSRAELEDLARSYAQGLGYTFDRLGGVEVALEQALVEFQWGFWQYLGIGACGDVPGPQATPGEIFGFLGRIDAVGLGADQFIEVFEPYFYQAATELGYPDLPIDHVSDLLLYENDIDALLPPGTTASHNPEAMLDIADFASTELSETIFIYGDYDPWTGGAFPVDGNPDVHTYVTEAGTHGARIGHLPVAQQGEILGLLESYTGVVITESPTGVSESHAEGQMFEPGLLRLRPPSPRPR